MSDKQSNVKLAMDKHAGDFKESIESALYARARTAIADVREQLPAQAGINEAKMTGNYYQAAGDEYDGGYVVNVFVDSKKVFDQIVDGDDSLTYKNKKFAYVPDLLAAIGKDHGGLTAKDFKKDKGFS